MKKYLFLIVLIFTFFVFFSNPRPVKACTTDADCPNSGTCLTFCTPSSGCSSSCSGGNPGGGTTCYGCASQGFCSSWTSGTGCLSLNCDGCGGSSSPTSTPIPTPTSIPPTPTPLPAPVGVSSVCNSPTQATIYWDTVTGADYYVIRVDNTASTNWMGFNDFWVYLTRSYVCNMFGNCSFTTGASDYPSDGSSVNVGFCNSSSCPPSALTNGPANIVTGNRYTWNIRPLSPAPNYFEGLAAAGEFTCTPTPTNTPIPTPTPTTPPAPTPTTPVPTPTPTTTPSPQGALSANPLNCTAPCSSTITWSTANVQDAYVNQNSGRFSNLNNGSDTANFNNVGTYIFYLFGRATAGSSYLQLDSKTVTVVSAPAPTATPTPIPLPAWLQTTGGDVHSNW